MLHGHYINLTSREDRRNHFENIKRTYPSLSGIERMPAIENSDGSLGCCLSHIKALTLCQNTTLPYVAIFEDDFTILNPTAFQEFLIEFERIQTSESWKVIVLTPRGTTIHREDIGPFKRIMDNQTTTGYIIKRELISVLIDNLKESARLQMEGVEKNISAIDQYWKRLQTTYPFYYYTDIFAGQLIGWSNIEGRNINYNERYIQQTMY